MKKFLLVLVWGLLAAGQVWAQAVPLPLVAVDKGDYTVCVDKARQKLYLFNGRSTAMTLNCSTGQNPGDKKFLGDKRTPEGIYFSQQIIEGTTLPPIYGWRAYVLDYPNPIDHYAGKNGHGIWIHGRNKPLDSTDTRGCVSLNNDDLKKIAPYLHPYKTPVVTLEKMAYASPEEQLRKSRQCREAIDAWLNAWQDEDIERYRACYAPDFVEIGTGRRLEAYLRYKQGLFNRYASIRLKTTAPRIVAGDDYLMAAFLLEFRGDNFHSMGVKYLYLDKRDYRILCERFVDLNAASAWNELVAQLQERPLRVAQATPFKPAPKPQVKPDLAALKAEVLRSAEPVVAPKPAAPKSEAVAVVASVVQTPAAAQPGPQVNPAPLTEALPPEVLSFLDQWRKAWENKDLATMRSYYTPDFPGLDDFFARKQRNLAPYDTITVAFDDMNIVQSGDYYEIRAQQRFRADNYQDFGLKQIRLVRQGENFLIMDESWRRLEDHT